MLNRPPLSRAVSPTAWVCFLALLLTACGPGPATPSPVILEPTVPPAATSEAAPPDTRPEASGSDVIFHNGVILTMDDAQPTVSAIHIQRERIVSVGDEAAVLAEAGPATIVVDLGGRTLMPGYVDSHSHMFAEPDAAQVQATLLRIGVTTTAEMYVDEPLLQRLLELDAQDALRVRLSAYLIYDTGCGEILDEWWRAYPPTRVPGEMLRIGGIKVFTDGGSCNAPAVTFDYANGVGKGDLYFTQPQLEAALRTIDEAGYQAAVHALGDRAIDVALSAFENLWHGDNPRRHRMEHNGVIRPDQLARYSAAQPVATIFAPFATCHKLGAATRFKYDVPNEFRTWEWPWRDLINANPGVHFAWHGDMPHVYPPDTAYQLFAMVTRAELAEDGSICQPPDWIAHNALTVDEALHLMTIGAAYALDRDAEVGSLVPGKFADVIILSDNPMTVDPLALRGLQVLMTMVGGRVEYCAEGQEGLCPAPSTAEPTPAPSAAFRDDFDGALDSGWNWLNEDPSAWSLAENPGWLRIELSTAGFLKGIPSNVLLREAPEGDFDLETTVRVSPSRNFELAGLLVYFTDGTVLQFGRGFCYVPGACVGEAYYFDNFEGGTSVGSHFTSGVFSGSGDRLRLDRRGGTYTAYVLADDSTWVTVGSYTLDGTLASIGLIAAQAPAAGVFAEFDYFEMTSP